MSELKPCPFCGGEALVSATGPVLNGKLMNYAYCEDCFCATPAKKTEAEAAAAWNTRHNPEEDALPMTDENMAAHGWKRIETCKVESSYWDELINDMRISLSCGHDIRDFEPPKFCPECGRKVER